MIAQSRQCKTHSYYPAPMQPTSCPRLCIGIKQNYVLLFKNGYIVSLTH